MDGIQTRAEDFTTFIQMAKVSPGIVLTGITGAVFLNRPRIFTVATITDSQDTIESVEKAGSRITGGNHTVKHIDAPAYPFHQVLRFADTHQVSRFVDRHMRIEHFQHFVPFIGGFADR